MQPIINNPTKTQKPARPLICSPINPRVCLVGMTTICALRGCTSEIIFEFVDSGKYLWVFDLAGSSASRRDLRFLAAEVADPDGTKNLNLDKVLSLILPPARATYPPGEACRRLGITRWTLKRLRDNFELPQGNLHRLALAKYLAARWVGANQLQLI